MEPGETGPSKGDDACSFGRQCRKENHVNQDEDDSLPTFEFVLGTHHDQSNPRSHEGSRYDDVSRQGETRIGEGQRMHHGSDANGEERVGDV